MTQSLHLHHVAVRVSDLQAAEKFYGQLLGLRKLWEFDLSAGHARALFGLDHACHFVTFAFDGGRLELFHCPEAPSTPAPGQHFGLTLQQRDALAEALSRAGAPIREILREGRRIVFTADPDGNLVELKPADPE